MGWDEMGWDERGKEGAAGPELLGPRRQNLAPHFETVFRWTRGKELKSPFCFREFRAFQHFQGLSFGFVSFFLFSFFFLFFLFNPPIVLIYR